MAHVDRPADEAAHTGAPGQRMQMLELICCRDVTVACCSAWSTRCADHVLSLAIRVWQASLRQAWLQSDYADAQWQSDRPSLQLLQQDVAQMVWASFASATAIWGALALRRLFLRQDYHSWVP